MTYRTDNRIRKHVQEYGFLSFAKKFGSKYGKTFINKGISASRRLKTAAKKFSESKYGKTLKKERLKFGKLAGKQLSDKIIPAAVDLARSDHFIKNVRPRTTRRIRRRARNYYSTTSKTKDY